MNKGIPGTLKPLIDVAGKEILAHILSIYEKQGITSFKLLGGYRIENLQHFANNYSNKSIKIEVLNTGNGTPTGGRLLQAKNFINEDNFLLTYGDSVTNFNLLKCKNLMKLKGANMSIATYYKKLEYGVLEIDKNLILNQIHEKTFSVPINAGFYILNRAVFDYIKNLEESFEIDVLPRLINDINNKILVYEVEFWHPMDTPDDREKLNKILLDNPNILFE